MSVRQIDVVQEQVSNADVSIYTAPTASDFESATIIYGNCTNVSTDDTQLTVNIVQSGGSVATTNVYFPTITVFAGSVDLLNPLIGAVLKASDFISTKGSAASKLNLKLTIRENYTDT